MNAIARTTDEKPLASDAYYMQGVIHRSLHGRWPIFKSYGMHRDGARIHCIARWLRMRTDEPYCVVTWNLSDLSIRWRNFRTLAEARKYDHVIQVS